MQRIARVSALALLASIGCTEDEGSGAARVDPDPPLDIVRDDTPPILASVRPPPLSGGTLLVTADERLAVVSDPDRDRVVLAELPSGLVTEIPLSPGDHPGRATQDPQGYVHVVLRDGGAVVTIDPAARQIAARWPVCAAPRGVAYDQALEALYVACASGELVRFRTSEGLEKATTFYLEPDLRDIVATGSGVLVSTLKGTNVLTVQHDGSVVSRTRPAPTTVTSIEGVEVDHEPSTAWRMIPSGDDRAYVVHSMARTTPIDLEGDGVTPSYGGTCDQPVKSELSLVSATGVAMQYHGAPLGALGLAVDVARSREGRLAIVGATSGGIQVYDAALMRSDTPCEASDSAFLETYFVPQAVAAAFAADGLVVIQSREPAQLHLGMNNQIVATIDLGGESRADTGYDLFHGQGSASAAGGVACASCHPEGREDGHVWHFKDVGARRTQPLAGTITNTAPFHWEGDLESLDVLMDEVMVRRMGAIGQSEERVAALQSWLESTALPVRAAPAFAESIGNAQRGKALFESTDTGCSSCHAGAALTNNESVLVGTGAKLQVPSLVGLSTRAPFMHDGCAATLHDRFEPSCGGGELHGFTAHLSSEDVDDLVAYMMTL